MNISKDICDAIQQHKEIQVEVQKYASELSAYNEIIQGKSKMHVIKIIMKQIGYKISEKYFFSYFMNLQPYHHVSTPFLPDPGLTDMEENL